MFKVEAETISGINYNRIPLPTFHSSNLPLQSITTNYAAGKLQLNYKCLRLRLRWSMGLITTEFPFRSSTLPLQSITTNYAAGKLQLNYKCLRLRLRLKRSVGSITTEFPFQPSTLPIFLYNRITTNYAAGKLQLNSHQYPLIRILQ